MNIPLCRDFLNYRNEQMMCDSCSHNYLVVQVNFKLTTQWWNVTLFNLFHSSKYLQVMSKQQTYSVTYLQSNIISHGSLPCLLSIQTIKHLTLSHIYRHLSQAIFILNFECPVTQRIVIKSSSENLYKNGTTNQSKWMLETWSIFSSSTQCLMK